MNDTELFEIKVRNATVAIEYVQENLHPKLAGLAPWAAGHEKELEGICEGYAAAAAGESFRHLRRNNINPSLIDSYTQQAARAAAPRRFKAVGDYRKLRMPLAGPQGKLP